MRPHELIKVQQENKKWRKENRNNKCRSTERMKQSLIEIQFYYQFYFVPKIVVFRWNAIWIWIFRWMRELLMIEYALDKNKLLKTWAKIKRIYNFWKVHQKISHFTLLLLASHFPQPKNKNYRKRKKPKIFLTIFTFAFVLGAKPIATLQMNIVLEIVNLFLHFEWQFHAREAIRCHAIQICLSKQQPQIKKIKINRIKSRNVNFKVNEMNERWTNEKNEKFLKKNYFDCVAFREKVIFSIIFYFVSLCSRSFLLRHKCVNRQTTKSYLKRRNSLIKLLWRSLWA